jgi:heme-degrading monooxygenase HmoA
MSAAHTADVIRVWKGIIRTTDVARYTEYVEETGLSGYRSTPGNLGAWIATRDLGDGRTEFVTVSRWASLEDIRGFAGDDIERAVFYQEDDEYLLERDLTVTHYLQQA